MSQGSLACRRPVDTNLAVASLLGYRLPLSYSSIRWTLSALERESGCKQPRERPPQVFREMPTERRPANQAGQLVPARTHTAFAPVGRKPLPKRDGRGLAFSYSFQRCQICLGLCQGERCCIETKLDSTSHANSCGVQLLQLNQAVPQ